MKSTYNWYFKLEKNDLDRTWKEGILTVDANVLLDLYRYHENTRNSLIESLQNFEGKLWLSRQAADEFFRNRNNVIIKSNKTFKEAADEIEKLKKSIESTVTQLKGNRIIPANIADVLLNEISPSIERAREQVEEAKNSHPDFLNNDDVLENVASLFENAIGAEFSKDDFAKISKEAEERKNKKIPPGYMDEEKDGNRPYGDYFLWKQILEHSKKESKPVIFVTSERKEDWWEKISGKTLGPRAELLKEALEQTGHRILIYQTDRFLEYSLQRKGQDVNLDAVAEIRAIDNLRSEKQQAVEIVSQYATDPSNDYNIGQLTIRLRRPVKNFTASGHFDPIMCAIPSVEVELTSAPSGLGDYRISAKTGTRYDFNIHLRPEFTEEMLPIGEYVFRYEAQTKQNDINQISGYDMGN
ncbi:PIN domain-containing protein [Pseudomonas benzopyrenica]|uniref:PIN domain-containing protein n=1 Tax=Pseudomonas benzopyrenica TaxID=2993566 RepID=UPI003F1731E3